MATPTLVYSFGLNGIPGSGIYATWTPGIPPVYDVGQVTIVFGVSASGAINTPSGWTQEDHTVQGSLHAHLWWKEYVGADFGTPQVFDGPTDRYAIDGFTWADTDPSAPISDLGVNSDGTAGSYPVGLVAPSITGGNETVLFCDYLWRAGSVTAATNPSGMTGTGLRDNAGIVDLGGAYEALTSGGATGARTMSVTCTGSYVESVSYSVLLGTPVVPVTAPLRAFPRDDDLGRVPTPRHPKFSTSRQASVRGGPGSYW